MTVYRKKPVEVEAIQFTGGNVADIWAAFGADGIYGPTETNPDHLILTTTHGDPAPARRGDWVVPDSKPGTFYPIKPDVFEATYEPAGVPADPGRPLPYGGTVAELRLMIARHAEAGEHEFQRAIGTGPGQQPRTTGALEGDEFDRAVHAHHAALYGWSIVALLRWLGEQYGREAAWQAAAIVADLGENGGNDFLDDIPPEAEQVAGLVGAEEDR